MTAEDVLALMDEPNDLTMAHAKRVAFAVEALTPEALMAFLTAIADGTRAKGKEAMVKLVAFNDLLAQCEPYNRAMSRLHDFRLEENARAAAKDGKFKSVREVIACLDVQDDAFVEHVANLVNSFETPHLEGFIRRLHVDAKEAGKGSQLATLTLSLLTKPAYNSAMKRLQAHMNRKGR